MDISIVTPSFRQPQWLRLCLSSVADQEGVALEHLVQDSCSGPEVEALASEFPHARFVIEKDEGMYDAVNRGLRQSSSDICAYINCDEQYLPGALAKVVRHMKQHPDIDILFGDVVVTDEHGRYTCSRQVLPPRYAHTKSCYFSTFTAAMFFRRRILEDHGMYFDTAWKDLGDAEWGLRAFGAGLKMGVLRAYVASFVDTGEYMNLGENAKREYQRLRSQPPRWPVYLSRVWQAHHRLRRLVHGLYWPQPFSYAAYTLDEPDRRRTIDVQRPTALWRSRL